MEGEIPQPMEAGGRKEWGNVKLAFGEGRTEKVVICILKQVGEKGGR